MLNKNAILNSMLHEYEVIKHLYAKIPEGGLDFKFTTEQRSILDLLRYLSYTPQAAVHGIITNDFSLFQIGSERAKTMQSEDFIDIINAQMEGLKADFAIADEAVLSKEDVTFPWGKVDNKAMALLNSPLKWLVGYRMQLFLQVKASGVSHIGTSNNWHGVDTKPKSA